MSAGIKTFFLVVAILALLTGTVYLQIFLSRRDNIWLGFILPFLSFANSIYMVFSASIYEGMVGGEIFGLFFAVLMVYNIPTMILIAICFFSRGKIKNEKAHKEISVQDLQ